MLTESETGDDLSGHGGPNTFFHFQSFPVEATFSLRPLSLRLSGIRKLLFRGKYRGPAVTACFSAPVIALIQFFQALQRVIGFETETHSRPSSLSPTTSLLGQQGTFSRTYYISLDHIDSLLIMLRLKVTSQKEETIPGSGAEIELFDVSGSRNLVAVILLPYGWMRNY